MPQSRAGHQADLTCHVHSREHDIEAVPQTKEWAPPCRWSGLRPSSLPSSSSLSFSFPSFFLFKSHTTSSRMKSHAQRSHAGDC